MDLQRIQQNLQNIDFQDLQSTADKFGIDLENLPNLDLRGLQQEIDLDKLTNLAASNFVKINDPLDAAGIFLGKF